MARIEPILLRKERTQTNELIPTFFLFHELFEMSYLVCFEDVVRMILSRCKTRVSLLLILDRSLHDEFSFQISEGAVKTSRWKNTG